MSSSRASRLDTDVLGGGLTQQELLDRGVGRAELGRYQGCPARGVPVLDRRTRAGRAPTPVRLANCEVSSTEIPGSAPSVASMAATCISSDMSSIRNSLARSGFFAFTGISSRLPA